MSFTNEWVVKPSDLDDDDDDWLNDDFDDLENQSTSIRGSQIKKFEQDVNGDDDDDALQQVLQLNQFGYYDADGNAYSQVQVTSSAFQVQEGHRVAEMSERIVSVALEGGTAENDIDGDPSDDEILDELYTKEIQRRIAEANKDWDIDISKSTEADYKLGEATGELQDDKPSRVHFAEDVQYFYASSDLMYESEGMTAHELMQLKEKSGDSTEAEDARTSTDDVNCVEFVNLKVYQSVNDAESVMHNNWTPTKKAMDINLNKTINSQVYGEHGDYQRVQNSRCSSPSKQLLKCPEFQSPSKAQFYIPPSRQTTPLKIMDSEDTVVKLKEKVNPILKSVLDPKLLRMLCKAPAQNITIIRELNFQVRENLTVIQQAGLPTSTLRLLDELSKLDNKKHKSAKAPSEFYRNTVSGQMKVTETKRKHSDKKTSLHSSVQNTRVIATHK